MLPTMHFLTLLGKMVNQLVTSLYWDSDSLLVAFNLDEELEV